MSFTVEVERSVPRRHARPGSAIGIDLGVKTLLTGVDDNGQALAVAGPRALRSSPRRLRRASRAHSRKTKGSAWRRESAGRLARVHARVALAAERELTHAGTWTLAKFTDHTLTLTATEAASTDSRRLLPAIRASKARGMPRFTTVGLED
ncbi:MAG: transposase [Streptosporangiaceae bacterium]